MGTATDGADPAPGTLGELLGAGSNATHGSEQEWAEIVRAIAAGDRSALRAVFDRSHRLVFTLIMRMTHDRATAEELTIDIYREIWRGASSYDPATATVLEWIMNEARLRAIEHERRCPQRRFASP